MIRFCLLAVALVILSHAAVVSAASFQGMGFLPIQGTPYSGAYGISADGNTVVGYSNTYYGPRAVTWTAANGLTELGALAYQAYYSQTESVSADGSVVAGFSDSNNDGQPFRWTAATGMQPLGSTSSLYGFGDNHAYAMTADGMTIVGTGRPRVQPFLTAPYVPFRWTEVLGYEFLSLPAGTTSGAAFGITLDGSTIVGRVASSSDTQAVRWTSLGVQSLGDLPGGAVFSTARAVSADGSMIAGFSDSSSGMQLFAWTSANGMVGLGVPMSGAVQWYEFLAMSADGSRMVGALGGKSFTYTAASGLQDLTSVLVQRGLGPALDGWTSLAATGISADDTTIVGLGTNPSGYREGWIAIIPEPSATVLIGQ
ncbi:MAG: hypothetical protein AB7O68_20850 [Pirellulales bacterium]